MDPNKDAQKLRDLRNQHGWTQENLAEEAGLDVRTVQRLESGATVRPPTRARLIRALGHTPEDLMVEELRDRVAELEEARASLHSTATPQENVMKVMYYRHPYHELVDYDVPDGAPVPRVGEFVVIPKQGVTEGEFPVQSFKVVRVLYAHDCYTDSRIRAQVDIAPVTSYD